MSDVYTPTSARQHFFEIIKKANEDKTSVVISPTKKGEPGAVVLGEDDWKAIQETLFLANAGVLEQVNKRRNDDTENFDGVWDTLDRDQRMVLRHACQ